MSEPTLAEALEAVRSIVSSIQSEASEFRAGVHPPQRTVVIPEGQYRSAKAALPVLARAVERLEEPNYNADAEPLTDNQRRHLARILAGVRRRARHT